MFRVRMALAAAGAATLVTGTAALATAGSADAAADSSMTALAGSAATFTSNDRAIGVVAGSRQLTVQLWLTPDISAATGYATGVSTPGDALFHRYLSPSAYSARFGLSASTVRRVEAWLVSQGFADVHTDGQRSYVRATASVDRIDRAFRVELKSYAPTATINGGRYALRANDRPVSLPAWMGADVLGVTGLDNQAPIDPQIQGSAAGTRAASGTPCSSYYGQNTVSGLPAAYGTTTFPTFICGYSGVQMRAAYGADDQATGKGQTIALVEQGLAKDMFLTLQDYAKANGVPAPSPLRYEQLSLGANSCGDPYGGEEQLDVEVSYDMAPGANQLVVGGDSCDNGDGGNQAVFDADIAILDGAGGHPLATVASNSWESGGESQPASWTNIEHAYLVRAAAEGVGMYFSAGDGSGVLEPAIDPFAIGVGGTTLGIGSSNNRLFETGWSTGASDIKDGAWVLEGEDGASGGGPSVAWPQPAYQIGVVPQALGTTRSGPDLSASADPFTGMALGLLSFKDSKSPTYSQVPIGGTSESSPLVAGMVTAAQQGQPAAFGFINPAIYRLSGTSAFFATLPLTSKSPAEYRGLVCDLAEFASICGKPPTMTLTTFDDQSPAMRGYTGQVTLPGYDNMTGLGTPDGPHFIADLRRVEREG
jgi:subtilase family serine protease